MPAHQMLVGAAALLATSLLAAPLGAQTQQQIDQCVNKDNTATFNVRVHACTDAINSGRWSGQALAWAFYSRGSTYLNWYDYDDAIADFGEAIRLDPKLAGAFIGRGKAHGAKGHLDLAIFDFSQAIRLDPTVANVYYERGNAYFRKGDYDRAISDFDQAVRLNPEDLAAFRLRGFAKLYKGDEVGGMSDIARGTHR